MISLARARGLVAQLEAHTPGQAGHAERVAVYSVATGDRLGLPEEDLMDLRLAAMLHDIGKLTLPVSLLSKTDPLSGEEIQILRSHVLLAREIFGVELGAIRHHHERWDGSGYPDGLVGVQIPLSARILAVAEVYDSLVQDCDWRDAWDEDEARAEIERGAGTCFDPEVVRAFLEVERLIQPV